MDPIFDDNTAYIKLEKCLCGCYRHCGFSCLTDDCDCNECLCVNCNDNGEKLDG